VVFFRPIGSSTFSRKSTSSGFLPILERISPTSLRVKLRQVQRLRRTSRPRLQQRPRLQPRRRVLLCKLSRQRQNRIDRRIPAAKQIS
jgi:hypothetical protein